MTNKEFIRRLREAKVEALRLWPDAWCISDGAKKANLFWAKNSTFGKETQWVNFSSLWVGQHARKRADIARVFDESIKNLGGKP